MKLLLISLLASSLFVTGCATKSEMKDLRAELQATQTALNRVAISEDCHGKILEVMTTMRQLNDPRVQADPMQAMEIQLTLQALVPLAQDACKKYDEMNGIKAK